MSKFNPKAVAAAVEEYEELKKVSNFSQSWSTTPKSTHTKKGKTLNHEGDTAYHHNPEMALYTLVCTMMVADKYYKSESEQMKELVSLVQQCHPLFVAKLAVYAREKMYLRTVPMVLTVELLKHISLYLPSYSDITLISRLVSRVIQRADEISELLAYYQVANSRDGETKKLNKLSNQIKKGIRQVFESGKFNEYQFAKYNKDSEVKLRDALFLAHPKPKTDEQKALFKKIADNTLEVPYTWEVELSKAGKDGRSKKDVWEELIDSGKVGYMAMLRNLRNIIQAEVSDTHMDKVCKQISDEYNVLKSKQLPYRFLSAYRSLVTVEDHYVLPSNRNREDRYAAKPIAYGIQPVIDALETAISYSVKNLPMLNGERILTAIDVSGSMITNVSPKSTVTYFDIAAMMGMITHTANRHISTVGMFGNTFKAMHFEGDKILSSVDEIHRREGEVGYSTNGHTVLNYAISQNKMFDRIMIFTDCQMWRSGDEYGYDGHNQSEFRTMWKRYRKINPNAKLYLFDLAGYGQTPVKVKDNGVHVIAGWSDRVFDILHRIENKQGALDEINSIEI